MTMIVPVGMGGTGAETGAGAATQLGVVSTAGNQTIAGVKTFSESPVVVGLNGGQLAGNRNKIINGKMDIAQRGTSFAAIASGAYSLDRWWVVTDAVGTVNVSQIDVSASGIGFRNAIRVERTAGTNRWNIGQNLETSEVVSLRGSTVTLSFWVRKGAALTSNLEVTLATKTTEAKFGANVDSATLTIPNASISTAAFTRFTLSLTIPSNSTAPGLEVSFQANQAGAANAFFDITGVQLEVGSVATPFEHRPFGAELALCQRYTYAILTGGSGASTEIGFQSGSVGVFVFRFPQILRAFPTFSHNATGFGSGSTQIGGFNFAGGVAITASSLSVTQMQTDSQHDRLNLNNLTNGTSGHALALNVGSEVRLVWSAEL